MLPGVARKIAIPFIVLSIAGFVLFVVGFGIRNVRYSVLAEEFDSSVASIFLGDARLDNAAKPEFFLFWSFLISGVIVYVMSFVHTFWDNNASKLLLNIFMLLFILGGGGVLLTDGLGIYHYYLDQNNGSPLFFCTDLYHLTTVNGLIPSDISGADNYVPIEFAGVVVSMLFYWIFLMISSFFASVHKVYE